jgi:hypothetical protein
MAYDFERITPAKASQWLNHNKDNRKLRSGIVEKYAEDMRQNRWTKCPVPISFYADGDVADGQHRLWAIVESETTQSFLVVRGLERKDGLNLDTGLTRTLVDSGRISGLDKGLTPELVACARAIAVGGPHHDPKRASNAGKLEMLEAHRDAAAWACTNGPRGKGLRNAIVMGALGRAYYHHPDELDRLKRFSNVVTSGMPQDAGEFAAVALRNYLLMKGPTASTSAMWVDTFWKAQRCIRYFMDGKDMKTVKAQGEEAYPLKRTRPRKQA